MKHWLLTLFACAFALYSMAQDPWIIEVENPLQGDYYGITSANGQIGIISSRSPLKIDKLVVGGIYDIYASGRVNNYFPNINPLEVELKVDGQRCERGNIHNYHQSFDMRNASHKGTFNFQDIIQVEYTTVALRQMPFGYMMDITIVANKDCHLQVLNQHRAHEALRNPKDYFSYIDNKANPYTTTYPRYVVMTTTAQSPTGRHQLAATSAFLFPDNKSGGVEHTIRHRTDRGVGRHTMEFDQILKQGDTLHIAIVGNIMGSNTVPDVRNEVERLTVYQLTEGYERLWKRHNTAWDKLWMSDIQITGDAQAQQDIHSMLYHHYAFFREGNAWSCSPMGLSGLGYNGHCFWDTETWMYPALLVMQPQLAKEALEYRYQRLNRAKQKAYFYGYKGALFPWESADSGQEEVAPHNMYPNAEIHITGDIAIAAWQYYCVTQDKEWLQQKGYSLIAEPADFWVSRVEIDDKGRANLYHVIGADEWNNNELGGKIIDNNAYTMGVAKTNLYYATQAARTLGLKPKKEWNDIANRFQFQYLPNGVTKEHDTYDGQITKQADVSLLAFPLKVITDTAQIRKDLEYYIDKVPVKKTPAMSKSIYSILYARLGNAPKALYYFYDSYLPNLNPPFRVIAEFNGGTNPYFITGAGGTLQSIIFGFAGLDITEKGLKPTRTPMLPQEWSSLTITVAGKDIVQITQ